MLGLGALCSCDLFRTQAWKTKYWTEERERHGERKVNKIGEGRRKWSGKGHRKKNRKENRQRKMKKMSPWFRLTYSSKAFKSQHRHEINVDLHLAKFKVTSSSQLWLDACATGSHALHYAPQTCQHNPIKISTSSRIRLRGYWMRKAQIPSVFFLMAHPMHLDNFGQTPILAPEITIECMKWKIQGLLRKPLQTVLVPKLLKTRPIRAMHPFTPFSHQHGFTCCH